MEGGRYEGEVQLEFCSYLVEVSKLGNLSPEISHDLLVVGIGSIIPVATALNQGVAESQADKVVLVQVAVVVNVW